jgi:hypothetical protein
MVERSLREAADSAALPLLNPVVPIPICEALKAKVKYLLPSIVSRIVSPEMYRKIIAVVFGSNEVLLKTHSGDTIKLNLGKAIQSSRLFSVGERKLLAATYGLIECADDIPGVDLFKQSKLDIVLDFLSSDEGGRHLNGRRQSWDAFLSSFDSWRFGMPKGTLRAYRNRAKKNRTQLITFDGRILVPGWVNEYGLPEIGDWLSFPTVPANKPEV